MALGRERVKVEARLLDLYRICENGKVSYLVFETLKNNIQWESFKNRVFSYKTEFVKNP